MATTNLPALRQASPALVGTVLPPGAKTPPLVTPDGRPLRAAELGREVARAALGSVRSIVSGHPAQNLTGARLARILLAAESGDALAYLELAEEMEEKDLHYLSIMGTRKRGVAQLPIRVEAASDSPEHQADADLVKTWLKRDLLEDELFDILDAVGKGFSVTEMIWRRTATSWLPVKLEWRDPRWFEFDRVDGQTLMRREIGGPVPLEAGKFIVHTHKAKSGLPIRGGIARAAAWGYMFKNFAIKDWLAFLETYGMPLRIGRYDNGETEENIAILMRAVAGMGADAAAVFPKTMEMELVQGSGGSGPAELWQSMAVYIDDQLSKAVLGQTNTTDAKSGGLGSGQADVHNEVRQDISRADAKPLAATLKRDLIIPMVIVNRGMREEYPSLVIGHPEKEDVAAMVDAAVKLVPLGLRVGARSLREKVGLPEPDEDEEVLSPPPPAASVPIIAPGPPAGPTATPARVGGAVDAPTHLLEPLKPPLDPIAAASAIPEPAEPDPIADAAGRLAGDWEAVVAPVTDPIVAAVASAGSLAELRDALAGLDGGLDVSALTEAVARARFAARLAGDADVQDESRAALDDG